MVKIVFFLELLYQNLKIFSITNAAILHLDRNSYKKSLQLAVRNSFLIFNKNLYKQIDGAIWAYLSLLILPIFSCLITNEFGYKTVHYLSKPYYIGAVLMTRSYFSSLLTMLCRF